jgi:hypothetical protein
MQAPSYSDISAALCQCVCGAASTCQPCVCGALRNERAQCACGGAAFGGPCTCGAARARPALARQSQKAAGLNGVKGKPAWGKKAGLSEAMGPRELEEARRKSCVGAAELQPGPEGRSLSLRTRDPSTPLPHPDTRL